MNNPAPPFPPPIRRQWIQPCFSAHPHPARVAGDDLAVAVAWLHDVVEDTETTLADLEQSFLPEVTAAVDALTRRDGETPADYYARSRSR
ncbi:hypothetical protein [Prescottella subtropica]|uniref:hypothetical protein n=1 Tax=Prescottella subtropica TaxID=2545757 RepID=UPI001F4FDDB0|nr:hypothetical protein [Prescottella subtropica]